MAKEKQGIDFSSLNLIVYQNEEFIDGLYQAIHGGITEESTVENSKSETKSKKAEAAASAKIPFTPTKGEISGDRQTEFGNMRYSSHKMTYSNAYRLHEVRGQFYAKNEIRKIEKISDINEVSIADFVEFKATFEKNDFSEILELLTPELGRFIGNYIYLDDIKKTGEAFDENRANSKAELGYSVVNSLHREFRNDVSSEFYGNIVNKSGNSINARTVMVCDREFFTNGDSDRLLDGVFSVFGKIIDINKSGEKLSKFERNKILKRIKPEAIELLQKKLKDWKDVNQYFETEIDINIEGTAIKIIPIAVYV